MGGCMALWTWRDLELKVSGNPVVDIDLLRKNAVYEEVDKNSEKVKYLWQVLESFGQADRQRFLRFCWGRSRLPPTGSSLWGAGFKIANGSDIPAGGLPRAHTCFFQIDLPEYSSFE